MIKMKIIYGEKQSGVMYENSLGPFPAFGPISMKDCCSWIKMIRMICQKRFLNEYARINQFHDKSMSIVSL